MPHPTSEIETRWCDECKSYVAECKHTGAMERDSEPGDSFTQLASVADKVGRGAEAAGRLFRGLRGAVDDAAAVFGGRVRKGKRR